MSTRPKADLLAELDRRLQALDCLSQPVKLAVQAIANAVDAPVVESYLEETLGFIERQIGSIDRPAFRDLCEQIAAVDDPSTIPARLGIRSPVEDLRLFGFGLYLIDGRCTHLYCLANCIAVKSLNGIPKAVSADLVKMTNLTFGNTVYSIAKQPKGDAILEDHLGLTSDDYLSTDLASILNKKLEGIALTNGYASMLYVQALVYALWTDGRRQDSARLLDARLGLAPAEILAPTFDEHLKQRLDAHLARQESVAYPARQMVVTEIDAAFDEFGITKRPARTTPKETLTNRARMLDELQSRLDRIDCLGLPTRLGLLQMAETQELDSLQFFFDHVLVVVEEEIAFVDHPKFRHLCNSLKLVKDSKTFARFLKRKSIEQPGYDAETEAAKSLYNLANIIVRPAKTGESESERTTAACAMAVDLASALHALGYESRAIRLLENRCGLSGPMPYEGDLSKPIATAFDGIEPIAAMTCVDLLARFLRDSHQYARAGRLMEAYLGLDPSDYDETTLPERLAARWATIQEDRTSLESQLAVYLACLAGDLCKAGRPRHAVTLLQAHLGIKSADYESPGFYEILQEKTWKTRPVIEMPDGRAIRPSPSLALHLASAHDVSGQHWQAIRLSQVMLQLTDEGYGNADEIRDNFLHLVQEDQIDADTLVALVSVLAHSFYLCGQNGRAGQLVTAVICTTPASSDGDLVRDFKAYVETFNKNTAILFVMVLGKVFSATGSYDAVLRIFEQLLDLPIASVTETAISQRLEAMRQEVDVDNMSAFVDIYAKCLAACGRHKDAGVVVDVFAGPFAWLEDPERGPTPENTVFLLNSWLRRHGREDTSKAQSICGRILTYSRRSLRRRGLSREDRIGFAERLRSLRTIVVELCREWATTGSADSSEEWNRLALLLDVELGQRALFERFLAEKVYTALGSDGASLVTGQWPFHNPKPAWIERFKGHLPGEDGPWPKPSYNEVALAGFDAIEDVSNEAGPAIGAQETDQSVPWLTEAEGFVVQGLDENRLARELGPNAVLLRASFTTDGTLKWLAFISNGTTLRVVCDNNKQLPSPADEFQIESAVALHDFEITLAYLEALIEVDTSSNKPGVLPQFSVVVQLAADLLDLMNDNPTAEAVGTYWNEFLVEMKRLAAQKDKNTSAVLGGLLEQLRTSWSRLVIAPAGHSWDLWCRRIGPIWQEAVAAMKAFTEGIARKPQRDSQGLGKQLDEATARFLDRVRTVWNLDSLGSALSQMAEQPDLVVHVDGVLHGVPVAHLAANGQPLYTRVRSARSSLSVLMDVLQRRIEAEANQALMGDHQRRLLTVSWFAPDDRAAPGAAILHHGQQALASQHGLDWLAAAEQPAGNWSSVQAGLQKGGLFVATVLGHGVWSKTGVRLADSIWNGRGTSLQSVGWLIVPSCTIGRVQESGFRDVEGFCVTLTLHRARSALACKWKVNAYETPVFANEVVAQYLALHDSQSSDAGTECRRARALNEARKRFLSDNDRRAHAWPGLNTVAAFELYGLG